MIISENNFIFVALDKEAQKASDNEKRAVTLKRELDDFKQKSKKQKVNQNDVRLQRALAEVRYRSLARSHYNGALL